MVVVVVGTVESVDKYLYRCFVSVELSDLKHVGKLCVALRIICGKALACG